MEMNPEKKAVYLWNSNNTQFIILHAIHLT